MGISLKMSPLGLEISSSPLSLLQTTGEQLEAGAKGRTLGEGIADFE